jgi:hypothetical protein
MANGGWRGEGFLRWKNGMRTSGYPVSTQTLGISIFGMASAYMIFLFIGSSVLTGGFLPTEPRDSAVASVQCFGHRASQYERPNHVLTHRGLSPHQFTPMSGAHEVTTADGGWRVLFAFGAQWPAAAEFLHRAASGIV